MPPRCELKIDSDLNNLEKVANFVIEAAEQAGLSDHEMFEVQMAVDEACTNVIQYAYGGEAGDVGITCEYDGECFRVTIQDHGKPFDPDSIPEPDLSSPIQERRVGGLGVFFMRKLMDEIHFELDDAEGNRLTMVKKVGPRAEAQ